MADIQLDNLGNALARANAQAARNDNPLENAMTYGKELYAGAVSDIGAIAGGITGKNSVRYTGDTIGQFWKGVFGDEKALETEVDTTTGEKMKLSEFPGINLAQDVANGIKGAASAAALGLLAETWNKTTGMFSAPVSNTANTLEQLGNITNERPL